MNYEDAAAVLAKIQAYDGRNVATANIAAWNEALSDIDRDSALAAVTEHFQESTDWLMPAHIVQRVTDRAFKGRQRIKAVGLPDFPTGMNASEEKEYRQIFYTAVAGGRDREEAQKYADARVVEDLAHRRLIGWDDLPSGGNHRAYLEAWLRDRELAASPRQAAIANPAAVESDDQ